MSKYTEHLGLVQPAGNEYYDIEQFNHNAELIDKEAKRLSTELTKVQEGATRDKAGIVQFGTGEGKALEGMMLARLAGCVGYGGDIQDEGVKDVNYLYYDRNTRKMYKCINQSNDTSANVNNFKPLDNNSLSELLEVKKLNPIHFAVLHETNGNLFEKTKFVEIYKLKNIVYGRVDLKLSKPLLLTSDDIFYVNIKIPELNNIKSCFGTAIIQGYNDDGRYDCITIPSIVSISSDKYIQIYNADASGYTANESNDKAKGIFVYFNLFFLD